MTASIPYNPSEDGRRCYDLAIASKRAALIGKGPVRLELPFPVPLHALWLKHKGGGGIPTPRYQAYGREAWAMIAQQKPGKIKGPVSVAIRLVAPDKRKRDGDNLLKCLFDTLKRNGIIEDDNNRVVTRHSLEWALTGPACVILVQAREEDLTL